MLLVDRRVHLQHDPVRDVLSFLPADARIAQLFVVVAELLRQLGVAIVGKRLQRVAGVFQLALNVEAVRDRERQLLLRRLCILDLG